MPKQELAFSKPLMNAAGTLGFAPDLRAPVDWGALGAFVTNPVSLRPRRASGNPVLLEFAGGFLLHTGLPNPGFRKVLQKFAPAWERAPLPTIVHLMADRPDESRAMVRELESIDGLLAIELGFAPLLADDIILMALELSLGELPIIVSLPHDQVLQLGPRLWELGAAAISLAMPRGSLPHRSASTVRGRLLGPALLPQTLGLVRDAVAIGLPVIGAGGVFSSDDAKSILDAGALAVQMDALLWLPGANKKSLVN